MSRKCKRLIFYFLRSKPGAAAMSTFFSNTIIGMDSKGYGSLLGQVSFTCSRVSLRHLSHEFTLVNPRSRYMSSSFQLIGHPCTRKRTILY